MYIEYFNQIYNGYITFLVQGFQVSDLLDKNMKIIIKAPYKQSSLTLIFIGENRKVNTNKCYLYFKKNINEIIKLEDIQNEYEFEIENSLII